MSEQTKRDLVLPPGTYAYMQDVTKGVVKTYTGPTVINPTAQERPVVFDASTGTFRNATSLEEAMQISPVAAEGNYIILRNPAKMNKHPDEGSAQPSAEQDIGRAIVVPGPATFALWPGQVAEVVEGHHLRSNQYLLIRVYNEDEARKNWGKSVMKPATSEGEASSPIAATSVPSDLTVGKLLIIKGTDVSFYIPPTGVEVVAMHADFRNDGGVDQYVRDALTLERLEYSILVDENGKKRYEVGPQVVFPMPSERFIESKDDNGKTSRKLRAIELNEIQGIHIKVIADYAEDGKMHKAGEELFITGKDTQIYYPREEHSAVKYDGKAKHFATAIPAGEARYLMNRLTGEIRTVKGPAMLLPDPRHEVIVRRILSDRECELWYPGNAEALEYNRSLRTLVQNTPTTRSGAVSEGEVTRNLSRSASKGLIRASMSLNSSMESSRVGGDQALGGEEFSRASSYTQPRTITLETKYQGAPQVNVWTGYACLVVSKTGKRRVEKGPTTVLLDYDETLETLELSTGKPKTTDKLLRVPYLMSDNNKVSDIISVETKDHVKLSVYVSYQVNFEGDPLKWFNVSNYVKLLCDHARSMLKGQIRKHSVETFYADSTAIIRDIILGKSAEGSRPGMVFLQNGMRVDDVDVLKVELLDDKIKPVLDNAQHDAVKTSIEVSNAKRALEVTRQKDTFAREEEMIRAESAKLKHALQIELAASELAVTLSRLANELRQADEQRKNKMEASRFEDALHEAQLERMQMEFDQAHANAESEQARRIAMLKAEAETTVQRFSAAQGGFSEALLALSHNETLVKVAEAWDTQKIIAGESLADTLARLFEGTPLKAVVAKLAPGDGGPRPVVKTNGAVS